MKVAVAYEGKQEQGRERRALMNRQVVAGTEEAERFWEEAVSSFWARVGLGQRETMLARRGRGGMGEEGRRNAPLGLDIDWIPFTCGRRWLRPWDGRRRPTGRYGMR
ncbi:hypothetical protein TC41_1148 [Alicyclobacillus acidocaldarius subsp. acidocaldarius Tc-4-1]|uniref:Uncharacterized protein n=1 Tax=Alicyclobacillus acidocaldarius (strain Tc-4-1) TaxID=1048834 RepID=F8IGS8_ALIAT|nr:hypothetical protein TC41_1148 [Alicyclobacillus acidocaldarius subsp. acidocaldarius Tc-4-1]